MEHRRNYEKNRNTMAALSRVVILEAKCYLICPSLALQIAVPDTQYAQSDSYTFYLHAHEPRASNHLDD
jgi:hypothetical protein